MTSCSISWTIGLDAIYWRLSVDGASYQTATANFEYGLDRNRSDHASIPDPSLSLSVVAVDGLGQTSLVATTAVATNAKPPTTSVVLSPGFNTIIPVIAASAAADFKTYLLRIVKDGTTVKTDRTLEVAQLYDVSPFGSGSYQVGVVVIDAFEQASTETLSSAAIIEPLTLTDLRIDASYEDDLGTSTTALDALKDANNTSGGPNYI